MFRVRQSILHTPAFGLGVFGYALLAFLTTFNFGVNVALAATANYNFDVPADYTTGAETMVNEGSGVAQFSFDWTLDDADFGTSGSSQSDLVTFEFGGSAPEDFNNLLFRADGKVYYCNSGGDLGCDNGHWIQTLEIIDSISDIAGAVVPDKNMIDVSLGRAVAVGNHSGNMYIASTSNSGTTWTNYDTTALASLTGATSVDYVAAVGTVPLPPYGLSVVFVAITDNGILIKSENSGASWNVIPDAPTFSGVSEMEENDGSLFIGESDGDLWVSDDQGATWDQVDGIADMSTGDPITQISFQAYGSEEWYVYVSGENFIFRGDLSADLDYPDNWVDQSIDIPSNFTYIDSYYSTDGIILGALKETDTGTDDGSVIASVDYGANWVNADGNSLNAEDRQGMAVGRLDFGASGNDKVLFIVRDGSGNLDAYSGGGWGSNAWIIPNTPFQAKGLTGITADVLGERDAVNLAFGFDSDPDGTWYYYNGAAWVSGVGTNASFSTSTDDLTPAIMQEFQNIDFTSLGMATFVRIYLYGETESPTPSLLGIDSLAIDYIGVASSGGGTIGDNRALGVLYTSPANGVRGVNLKKTIKIIFDDSLTKFDLDEAVGLYLKVGNELVEVEDFDDWTKQLTTSIKTDDTIELIPKTGTLEVGADYVVRLIPEAVGSIRSISGKQLPTSEEYEWSFHTVNPAVRFLSPVGDATFPVNQPGTLTVGLVDNDNDGTNYPAETDLKLGLVAKANNKDRKSGIFGGTIPCSAADDKPCLAIPTGTDQVSFTYTDSKATETPHIKMLTFPNPQNGWPSGLKTVIITDSQRVLKNRLDIDPSPGAMAVGASTPAMLVSGVDTEAEAAGVARRKYIPLPKTKLYFSSESPTGTFYTLDRSGRRVTLPYDNAAAARYLDNTEGLYEEMSIYYTDSTAGVFTLSISDQLPNKPDTGFADAAAVVTVVGTEELVIEQPLLELIPVVDDTGRDVSQITMNPSQLMMLPGANTQITANAVDAEGNPVEGLEYTWYVLAGGGTILKHGLADLESPEIAIQQLVEDGAAVEIPVANSSNTTIFTAGEEVGIFPDTIMVATLYNGKVSFATISVAVGDPATIGDMLPTTGINGLQIILLGLTFLAAVALAWVESYEKKNAPSL
jgi:hypothetical protein